MFTLTKPDDSHLISAVTTQSTNNVGQKTTIKSTEVLSDVIKSRYHSFRLFSDFSRCIQIIQNAKLVV